MQKQRAEGRRFLTSTWSFGPLKKVLTFMVTAITFLAAPIKITKFKTRDVASLRLDYLLADVLIDVD